MELLARYKWVIGTIVAVAVAFFAYSYFFTGSSAPVLSSQPASATSAVDQDLINLLLTLKNIKLDDSLFADPSFKSLQDYGKDLVPEPVGRANPFAPLSGVSAPTSPIVSGGSKTTGALPPPIPKK